MLTLSQRDSLLATATASRAKGLGGGLCRVQEPPVAFHLGGLMSSLVSLDRIHLFLLLKHRRKLNSEGLGSVA